MGARQKVSNLVFYAQSTCVRHEGKCCNMEMLREFAIHKKFESTGIAKMQALLSLDEQHSRQ